jgi:hypothetical protein
MQLRFVRSVLRLRIEYRRSGLQIRHRGFNSHQRLLKVEKNL